MPIVAEFHPERPADDVGGMPAAVWHVLTVVVALLALLPIVFATPSGLGLSPDSTQYLAAARSFMAGQGLMTYWWSGSAEPLTHFPPIYPAVIAVLGRVTGDPRVGALALNLTLVPINVLLLAVLSGQLVPSSAVFRAKVSFVSALFAALANDLAVDGAMLWSEPLFISLLLVTLIGVVHWLNSEVSNGRRTDTPALLMAAGAAGAATLTRYVGIALIGACVLSILLLSQDAWRARTARAVLFGCVSVTPFVLWSAFNLTRAGTASNREIAVHIISFADLIAGGQTLSRWVVPYFPNRFLRLLGFGSMVALLGMAVRCAMRRGGGVSTKRASISSVLPTSNSLRALLMFLGVYLCFLLVSISFVDRSTDLDMRMLSPALPIAIAIVVALAANLLAVAARPDTNDGVHGASRPLLTGLLFTAAGVYMVAQTAGLVRWSSNAHANGLGLATMERSTPALLAKVRSLPGNARVYSNMPYALYYFTDRVAVGIPRRYSPTSLRPNSMVAAELTSIGNAALRAPTYIVLFDIGLDQAFLASEEDLAARVRVDSMQSLPGGRIEHVVAPVKSRAR